MNEEDGGWWVNGDGEARIIINDLKKLIIPQKFCAFAFPTFFKHKHEKIGLVLPRAFRKIFPLRNFIQTVFGY
jgi:hypothetical protein